MAAISLDIHPYKDQKTTQIAHFKWFLQRFKLLGQKEEFTREKKLFGLIHKHGHCFVTMEH